MTKILVVLWASPGKGRLQMDDGSFTEGQFVDGQICGFGKRFMVTSKTNYEGFFESGEMHGRGRMKYGDGAIYDGYWHFGQRSG